MNRRDLLGLGLAAAGGIFAPKFGRWYREATGLILWGDGVHDDSAALQALFDGTKPVRYRGEMLPRTGWTLQSGNFLVKRTVVIPYDLHTIRLGAGHFEFSQ